MNFTSKVALYLEKKSLLGLDLKTDTQIKRRNLIIMAMRDGKHCSHCKKPLFFLWEQDRKGYSSENAATFDHVKTKKDGGTYEVENGILSCQKCNCDRGHQTVEKYRKLLAEGFFTKESKRERKRLANKAKRKRKALRKVIGLDKAVFVLTALDGKTYINTVMKTFQAKIYVKNGYSKIPHTVQFNAETPFAAQQMLIAQYGANNVISVPIEVKATSTYNSAPWMINIG